MIHDDVLWPGCCLLPAITCSEWALPFLIHSPLCLHTLVAAMSPLRVTFILLVSFSSFGFAIRCWVCRSDSDPKCGDPFDNRTLPITDCDIVTLNHLKSEKPRLKRATMCRKIRQKVEGNWRILRGCAFLGEPGEGTGNEHHCLIRQGTHDIYMEYCTCDSKDGCNSGPKTVQIQNAFMAISFFISIFLIV